MNNVYSILWFDDNARSQKAFENRLRQQLKAEGFELDVEYYQKTDEKGIGLICDQMRIYNKFDLIMFDHKLEGSAKGAKFAAIFRQNKIYTDMVYYSSSDVETLWTALRRERVDGVYVLNRDGMDDDLIRIVKEQVARVFDVSNMRGFILQFMSQVEGALRMRLLDAMDGSDVSDGVTQAQRITTIVAHDEKSIAKKKIDKMGKLTESSCRKGIVDGIFAFDRVRTVLSKLSSSDKLLFGSDSLLAEMQKIRNVFAHRRHRIDPNSHRLFLEGDKTHPDGYSADDFKKLRVQLMALSEELETIIGKL
jgi:hypothetical protein